MSTRADRSAYEAAVSSYADMGPDELRAAALRNRERHAAQSPEEDR